MRIRTSIHLALGTVLVLHIFTAVMGHAGLDRSTQNLEVYESVNSDTLRVLSIDQEISELQRRVSEFMLTGHESSAEQVQDLIIMLRSNIEKASETTEQVSVALLLEQMSERIDSFAVDFEKVVVDRQLKSDLVQNRMIPIKKHLLERLDENLSMSGTEAQQVREYIHRAESAALRYFDTPSRSRVDETISSINRAQSVLTSVQDPNGDIAGLEELFQEYNQVFLEAVQATQGYMHLVNVVLAGDALELYYQSSQIRKESLAKRAAIGQEMKDGVKRFQAWSDLVAILTVMAGIITAWVMTRTVLSPILGMTHTFEGLTKGQDEVEVPYLGRHDEIGMMANAAEVFRLKNDQTEVLLHESRMMQEDLERRNNEMTEFVYTVSHDLKSPLVTIQGFTGVLEYAVEMENYDEVQGMVGRIQAASVRLSKTVDDLLELSRVGMMVNEFAEFKFKSCVTPVLLDLASQIEISGARIEIEGEDELIYADQSRIQQVIQNLLQNAIAYGHDPGETPEIVISARKQDGETVISVSDHGPGVEEDYQERIFGIFQRLSNDKDGTGVGLAIVRKVAVAHNGHAWVESGPDGGCVFSIRLPVVEAILAA